jgi:hypothetical protein
VTGEVGIEALEAVADVPGASRAIPDSTSDETARSTGLLLMASFYTIVVRRAWLRPENLEW